MTRPGGGLMVCGTASDVGKSTVVAGLCRVLARRGVRVAPFKAQNMALNSYVTLEGREIGRAQAAQAFAAGLEPEVSMNPILLKPEGDRTSQVLVNGEVFGRLTASQYEEHKPGLLQVVLEALEALRGRFEVVLVEGAGGAAEINLAARDLVNLRLAAAADLPVLLVGDIDRGGVFAALFGTLALLPEQHRRLVRGFVINKFRGDPSLLAPGLSELERRCGVPTLGVLPYAGGLGLDGEDSLGLLTGRPRRPASAAGDEVLDVAVVALPRLSNYTDLDPLLLEPSVCVRLVSEPALLGTPDLVIIPGTKTTVADLEWLRTVGFDAALTGARQRGSVLLGICGGYQMLGGRIADEVEPGPVECDGLGMLPVTTRFRPDKVTRRRRGVALGEVVCGYEIHHGRVEARGGARAWVQLEDVHGFEPAGTVAEDGAVLGTSLHGLFDEDGFRARFLAEVAARQDKALRLGATSFAAAREAHYERLADLLEDHLELDVVLSLIENGVAA